MAVWIGVLAATPPHPKEAAMGWLDRILHRHDHADPNDHARVGDRRPLLNIDKYFRDRHIDWSDELQRWPITRPPNRHR